MSFETYKFLMSAILALHTTKYCTMNITKLAGCDEVQHIYCSSLVEQLATDLGS